MDNKILALLSIVFFLTSLFLTLTPVRAEMPLEFPRNNMAPKGPYPIDGTYMLGEKEMAFRKYAARAGSAAAASSSPVSKPVEINEEYTITVADIELNIDYEETFVVIINGVHGIILIEKKAYDNYDSTTDEYVFPNPFGCWRTGDRISTVQLRYLLDQFDTVIYPTNTSIFGEPMPRGAEGKKTWILIHNIRDESYYDCNVNMYIIGYFSASEDYMNNKNMMHIDTFDWLNRTGPDAIYPFNYEGAFAHEFEHLIHFDLDPDEESWVDEGLASLAIYLCGYGHCSGHIAYYLMEHQITSLTFWGKGLADYGASYLFSLYLYEHFSGIPFISALVKEQTDGIEGIEKTLTTFGYQETFNNIFDNWTITNYVDDTEKMGGKYGYNTLDIGTADTWGYSIEYGLRYWATNYGQGWDDPIKSPFTVDSNWFFNIEPHPYTAHYFRFNNKSTAEISIDGDNYSGIPSYSGSYEWYSGAKAWAWRSISQTFSIPASGATLNFFTYYEIEEDWDYGYVEIYDHDTGEWYTLEAPGITVNHVGHKQDNPFVPPGHEPKDYEIAGRWHAFTGYSNGWTPVSMSLCPFAGHTIDIHFRTWQDGSYTLQMMYVDDISIPEIGFFDDVEAGEGGWSTDGWYRTDGKLKNGFSVTTIDTKWVPTARYPEPVGNSGMNLHNIYQMMVDPDTQSGTDLVSSTRVNSSHVKVCIVTNHADHIISSHYRLAVTDINK